MKVHLAMLVTDWLLYILLVIGIVTVLYIRRRPHLREPWRQLLYRRSAMITIVIIGFYALIGLLDSIHLEVISKSQSNYQVTQIVSVFDLLVSPLGQQDEKTYSEPFATHLYSKDIVTLPDGTKKRAYPRLRHGGSHLQNQYNHVKDIGLRILLGFAVGLVSFIIIATIILWLLNFHNRHRIPYYAIDIIKGRAEQKWRAAIITFGIIWVFICMAVFLATSYHIFGTDKVGQDVFYESVKSIRTGLIIGTLTTLFMLPFALILGTSAGFFKGWVDDVIQYIYITLSSIPGVLLISASILVLQVYIASHADLFPTLIQRADARLLALCFILGITSWATLCRLLRGETLKIRDQEFIQAARAMSVNRFRIILRHIIPNVFHIVLITLVLDFSQLVLAEAVLSYVGVGVDPTTMSWGNMINSARLQLAREPIVWWPLIAALIFMFILVLSANIFSDAVRDALDPRLRQMQ